MKLFGLGFGLMDGNYSSRFYYFNDCFALLTSFLLHLLDEPTTNANE